MQRWGVIGSGAQWPQGVGSRQDRPYQASAICYQGDQGWQVGCKYQGDQGWQVGCKYQALSVYYQRWLFRLKKLGWKYQRLQSAIKEIKETRKPREEITATVIIKMYTIYESVNPAIFKILKLTD